MNSAKVMTVAIVAALFFGRIETTFSQLVSLYPRKIHAVTKEGFLLKLIVFVVSFSLKLLL